MSADRDDATTVAPDLVPRRPDGLGIALRDPTPDAVEAIAAKAEEAGFTHLLIPETGQILREPVDGRDPFLLASIALDATRRLVAGPGIAGTVFRSARHLAIASATVNERSGGRFVTGIGVSHRSLAEPLGMPFPSSPLRHAADYCDELIRLSQGGLAFGGGFEVLLAARGDRMLGVAARHSHGALLTWSSPAEVRRARALVEAEASGRRLVGVLVRVGRRSSLVADAEFYGGVLPGYAEHFARQGLTGTDDVVHSACIDMDDAGVAPALEAYRSAGATLPCLYPSGLSTSDVLGLLEDWPSPSA